MSEYNVCQSCGACCSFFRVLFSQSESDETGKGTVPIDFTVKISETRIAMKGTEQKKSRCIALTGKIGLNVCCSIYSNRPSVCRNFAVAWENGSSNWLCDQARASYGLQPFSCF